MYINKRQHQGVYVTEYDAYYWRQANKILLLNIVDFLWEY